MGKGDVQVISPTGGGTLFWGHADRLWLALCHVGCSLSVGM